MRRSVVVTMVLSGFVLPPVARGAGGPVPPVVGQNGIGLPHSPLRFIASPAGRDTVVERVTSNPRRVQSTLRLGGRYGIPGADFNGATTGLSADGRTLLLEGLHRSGRARLTRLIVLDTAAMRVRKTVVLQGWSTVDAISPHGRWLYLIHYPSWPATGKYEVMAYDLRRGKLISQPIVDPHDRGEAMTGFPISRVMSSDGRWAYTLYGRPSGEPFVHALDTVRARAVCIDLPSVSSATVGGAHLKLGDGAATLEILSGGLAVARIDTHTFAVSSQTGSAATAASVTPAANRRSAESGGGWPWELLLLPIAALALGAAAVWRRARPRAI